MKDVLINIDNDINSKRKLWRNKSLRFLSKRDYTRHEIEEKISHIFSISEDDYDDLRSVLDDMEQSNWINDDRFTQNFVRYQRNRGKGPLYISHKLQQKGVAKEIINTYCQEDSEKTFEHMRKIWKNKFGNKGANCDVDFNEDMPENDVYTKGVNYKEQMQDKARQMRFLLQRGFTHDQVRQFFYTKNKEMMHEKTQYS